MYEWSPYYKEVSHPDFSTGEIYFLPSIINDVFLLAPFKLENIKKDVNAPFQMDDDCEFTFIPHFYSKKFNEDDFFFPLKIYNSSIISKTPDNQKLLLDILKLTSSKELDNALKSKTAETYHTFFKSRVTSKKPRQFPSKLIFSLKLKKQNLFKTFFSLFKKIPNKTNIDLLLTDTINSYKQLS